MSYQVLARKWRPEMFSDLVGQEHVLQALVQGLQRNRLHHAYLFTGTRGVGKTTIGRILARCLNCETGVTATPCGECGACREIAGGRFVDLIEIDAASRTKVEDMRELLDNVQYSPTRGRFKIYLIDEVHMLSNSSFNALLKTLEEPPEHVKFLFATTDPQKLPVTILSRCLQFNLKQISPERIVGYLKDVLSQEGVTYEDSALWLLARAADGSMRDALSLTDQAIAFCSEALQASQVSSMLGTIDRGDVFRLIEPLLEGDGRELLAQIGRIADFAPDFAQVLGELLSVFHRVSLEQCVPGSVGNALGDEASIRTLASRMSAEDTQLFYQTALMARQDLSVTPDARMGFEMALLRMLAFRPGTGEGSTVAGGEQTSRKAAEPAVAASEPASPVQGEPAAGGHDVPPAQEAPPAQETAPPARETAPPAQETAPQIDAPQAETSVPVPEETPQGQTTAPDTAPEAQPSQPESVPLDAYEDVLSHQAAEEQEEQELPPGKPEPVSQAPDPGPGDTATATGISPAPEPGQAPPSTPAESPDSSVAAADFAREDAGTGSGDDWMTCFDRLNLPGMAGNLAANAAGHWQDQTLTLVLDANHFRLLNERHQQRICESVRAFWPGVSVSITQGEPGQNTPAAYRERQSAARQQQAVEAIHQDPVVQRILEQFDARVVEDSIRPQ